MKIIWLGQAGLLFEIDGKKILIDPYLSNSVAKIQPWNYRRVEVDEKFLQIVPDVIVITHNHIDHLDKETLRHYLTENSNVTVLAPNGSWQEVRKFSGLKNNYVLFNKGTTWTENFASFSAVKAEHSDEFAIGLIINAKGKNYYITGDTLYNEEIFNYLPKKIDYIFVPINGKGNNMNMLDAKIFCEKIGGIAVPMHSGLFDDINMNDWQYDKKIVPEFFKEIKL